MKVAALDLGSNTFICLIAEVENAAISNIYYDSVELVRLGEGVSATKKFSGAALLRAEAALEKFSLQIRQESPARVRAVATAAARSVDNPEALLGLCQRFNIPLEIISGDKEAQVTFRGGLSGLKTIPTRSLMLDIGGGSTEFIAGNLRNILQKKSLPIGAVKLTEQFPWPFAEKPPLGLVDQMRSRIRDQLGELGKDFDSSEQSAIGIALAGTAAELGRLEGFRITGQLAFDSELINRMKLDRESLDYWCKVLASTAPAGLVSKYQVQPKRADVLLAGCLILQEALTSLGLAEWQVSTRGIRFGAALEIAEEK